MEYLVKTAPIEKLAAIQSAKNTLIGILKTGQCSNGPTMPDMKMTISETEDLYEKGEKNMIANKTIGNRFEAELCTKLYDLGWWAHNMAQSQIGQPADIIACKNGNTVLIDCKDCKNDRFSFDRVEPNQRSAMKLFQSRSFWCGYFALRISTGIYFVSYDDILFYEQMGKKSIGKDEIETFIGLEGFGK